MSSVQSTELETLRRNDARYRSLLLASASIVWITDATGVFVEPQPDWERYTGQSWDEYRESRWISAVHPDDRASVMEDWTTTVRAGSDQYRTQGRVWSAAHNGWRAFQTRGVSVRNAAGNIVEWVGALTDVQDAIDAARERDEALAELKRREDQFRTLADTMPLLAWYANPDGYIPWYNRRWFEYTGTTLEQQAGWKWTSVHDPDDLPRIVAKWRAALASGEPWEDEFRLRRHDGRLRWFLSRAMPLRDGRGRIIRWFGTNVDVDDQKRAAEASARARQALEQASRAKDEFLATLSHELRTPLTSIVGWSTMLVKDHRDEAKLERGLTAIVRNAQAQTKLVSDLLDVSRIITGKLRLGMKTVQLSNVVHAAADVVRPTAEAKGVRLLVDLEPDLGATVGDPDRLQQVVWNLLSNAVRFTSATGRVTVTGRRDGGTITLRVQDTGAGIAAEHLPHVFERFRQVDSSSSRVHGGLGLGLAIVRHLVEAHGGTATAASEGLGRGATFTIALPIRAIGAPVVDLVGADPLDEAKTNAAVATPSAAEPEVADATSRSPSVHGVRALLVEDDPDSLDLIQFVLEEAGAKVTSVASAKEALEARGPFDIIISDIGMPEMDGYAFMRRIRSSEDRADVPAIALTAYARSEDADRAIRAGYQEHLVKPVDSCKLLDTVRSWARPVHASPSLVT